MIAGHPSAVENNRNLLAHLYIRSARHDLGGSPAQIHLTYNQLVSVRMALNLCDLAYNNLVQVFIQALISLYLRSCQCHGVCVFLRCDIEIRNICFYP